MDKQISREELDRQAEWVAKNIHKNKWLDGAQTWDAYRTTPRKIKWMASRPNDAYFVDED